VIAGNWRQCGCCRLLLPSGPPLVPSGHSGEHSGPRPPHGASAATTSNGLCDHTRAMPRPVANIVRLRLCDAPHGSSNTFGRTAAALPVYLHRLALEEGEGT